MMRWMVERPTLYPVARSGEGYLALGLGAADGRPRRLGQFGLARLVRADKSRRWPSAIAELALHPPHEVAALLAALHEVGAAEPAAALAERLPAAGMFAQIAEVGDRAERFRYGCDYEGSAAARWSWEDLQ